MARDGHRTTGTGAEGGQAALLMLGVLAVVLAGVLVLFGFGQALGAKGRHRRAADLAAISAAQVMRDLYPRLFEPPFIEPDISNPRHLEEAEYRELAIAAAIRGGRRNGVQIRTQDVTFPRSGFAPTQVTVRVRGHAPILPDGHTGDGRGGGSLGAVPIRARATAELLPAVGADGLPSHAS